jgi:hypothetical protein
MRKVSAVLIVIFICALWAVGEKQKGLTTLKDVQPAGTTDKKKKNQQYDLVFEAMGMHYTCRTSHDKSIKITDFVVGTNVDYEIDGNKSKLKNTAGKKVGCTVVRVEKIAGPQATTP